MLTITVTTYSQPMFFEEPEVFKVACEGNLEKLESMLSENTDVEIVNSLGSSLLHKAASCGQMKVVEYLIEKGIDVNKKDNSGITPLLVAISVKNEPIISILKKQGAKANFDIIYPDGLSPLEKSILFGDLKGVQLLVENGANVNTINVRKTTPLGMALRDGFDEIASYLISKGANTAEARLPVLNGEYLGQEKPGLMPKLFAPGIVSIEHGNINASFHPNGKEIYFTVESPQYNGGAIMVTKMKEGAWSRPEPLHAVGDYTSWEPFVSADGMKLYYVSKRPINPGDSINDTMDIWMLERNDNDWSSPVHLGSGINTKQDELHPTVAQNGNLYYSNNGIQFAEYKNGGYSESTSWIDPGDTLNWNADPFIAPDESYLIFTSYRPGGFGEGDLYISFKNDDGTWTPAKNMGESINSTANEFPSGLTPDGKYFIFASSKLGFFMPDIYWVDARFIDDLR